MTEERGIPRLVGYLHKDPVHPGHKTSGRDPPKRSIRSKTQTWNQHGSFEKLANLHRKQHVSAHADVRNLSLVTSFGFKSKNLRRIEMIEAPQRQCRGP
jgi:hypothetical protein